MRELVSHARLTELLNYCPDTGVFTHRIDRGPGRAGNEAGTITVMGYRDICLDYKHYYGHRLAWFYVTAEWPDDQIDHINGDRADNRFANLRVCTNQQNTFNMALRKSNTSGFRGVTQIKETGRWRARIKVAGKEVALGVYTSASEAGEAYENAAQRMHGEFFRPA